MKNQKKENTSRVFFWLYILAAYVCVQFLWWAYLIIDLQFNVHNLRNLMVEIETKESLMGRVLMIVGEGAVFFLLLAIGFYQVRKSFVKEYLLARQQQNFLLSITHELNSPLASIKLFIQTLRKRNLEGEKKEKVLDGASKEIERLTGLVNNILMATRLDNSSYQFYIESCDLVDIVTGIVQSRPNGRADQIIFNVEGKVEAETDKIAFSSIVTNLLENAEKYAPDDSNITINLTSANNKIKLEVGDNGPGVPAKEREEVFKKFYRVGSEDTRKTKGTGLGLYLVAFFVKSLRGKIELKENAPKGALFIVELPKSIKQA